MAFDQPPTDRGWSRTRPAVLELAIEKATLVIETEQRRRKAPALFDYRYHLDKFRHRTLFPPARPIPRVVRMRCKGRAELRACWSNSVRFELLASGTSP